MRRLWIGLLAALALVGILAAVYILREPPVPDDSIERLQVYQDPALIERAWALPVARRYGREGYLFQQNQSVCGPTSVADVLRSEDRAADPKAILDSSGAFHIFGILPLGLTLDQEADLMRRTLHAEVKVLRGISLDDFRNEMAKSNEPSLRLVINFTRDPLFGRGHGHFSPVLGYLSDQDLVFVGDVNAKFRPWLVPTARLYAAENTTDSISGLKRGVLEIEAR